MLGNLHTASSGLCIGILAAVGFACAKISAENAERYVGARATFDTTTTTIPTSTVIYAPLWYQCGGMAWWGPTQCVSPNICIALNAYYSQCQPPPSTITGVPTVTSPWPCPSTTCPICPGSETTTFTRVVQTSGVQCPGCSCSGSPVATGTTVVAVPALTAPPSY